MLCDYGVNVRGLEHNLVDGPLNRLELALELAMLGGGHARGDDRSGDVAGAPQSGFRFNEDIWNVLQVAFSRLSPRLKARRATFSSQSRGRCKRISIGSVSAVRTISSAIPRLSVFVAGKSGCEEVSPRLGRRETAGRTLVGALFELLVLGSLIDELQDLVPGEMRMQS